MQHKRKNLTLTEIIQSDASKRTKTEIQKLLKEEKQQGRLEYKNKKWQVKLQFDSYQQTDPDWKKGLALLNRMLKAFCMWVSLFALLKSCFALIIISYVFFRFMALLSSRQIISSISTKMDLETNLSKARSQNGHGNGKGNLCNSTI